MCCVLTCLQDVLGHQHTRAFVSHCGVHSINEAAFHGVPVVAVPIQFEQVSVLCAQCGQEFASMLMITSGFVLACRIAGLHACTYGPVQDGIAMHMHSGTDTTRTIACTARLPAP